MKRRTIPRGLAFLVDRTAFMRIRITSCRRHRGTIGRHGRRRRLGSRVRHRRRARHRLSPAAPGHKNRRAAKQRRQRKPSAVPSTHQQNCWKLCRDFDHHDRAALMTVDLPAVVGLARTAMTMNSKTPENAAPSAIPASAQIGLASPTHRAKTTPFAAPSPAQSLHQHTCATVPSLRRSDAQSLQSYPCEGLFSLSLRARGKSALIKT